MDPSSPNTVHPSPAPPSSSRRWALWLALGLWFVLFLMAIVPALGRSGPTRVAECHFAQADVEQLADAVSTWEKIHPQTPPWLVEDLWKVYTQGTDPTAETDAFMKAQEFRNNTGGNFIWQSAPSAPRREGPYGQARIVALFRYSRGREDPVFELRSWDRGPMNDYMAFAKRKEIMKIVSALFPWAVLFTVGVVVIAGVYRCFGAERG